MDSAHQERKHPLRTARGPLGIYIMALAIGLGAAVASYMFTALIEFVYGTSQSLIGRWGAPALVGAAAMGGLLVGTALTIGSGGSGGIFFPGLFIGAALGGSFGYLVNAIVPGIAANPGAYALVGMGAFFAGMTHAPMTGIIMLFEMTRDYRIILPLMLACVVASVLSKLFNPESIYTLKLARQGIRLHDGREVSTLQSLSAADVMSEQVDIVHSDDSIAEVITHFQKTHHTGFPVLDRLERLQGVITLSDIRRTPLEGRLDRKAREVMTSPVTAVTREADLDAVLRLMSNRDIGRVMVVEVKRPDRLVGLITRSDIVSAYNAKLLELG